MPHPHPQGADLAFWCKRWPGSLTSSAFQINSAIYDVASPMTKSSIRAGTSSGAPTSEEVASAVAWLAPEAGHNTTGVEVPMKSGRFTVGLYI